VTDEQAHMLRAMIAEALHKTLGKPIAFVIVAQDESRNVEVITNAQNREALPKLLEEAAEITRKPPQGSTKPS